MPRARICRVCGDLTTEPVDGCCPDCAPVHQAREVARRAAKPQRRIWDSYAWQQFREQIKERDGRTCADCGRHESELEENERLVVDHVNGVLAGDPLNPDTVETVCSTCSGGRDGGRPQQRGYP